MLTKLMAVVVTTGALGVAGHALVSEFGCPFSGGCCHSSKVEVKSNCCSTEQTSDCCSVSRSACCMAAPSSESTFVYSESTGQVHLVQRTDGGYQCVATGEILSECCCVPLVH
jgi:hypothetical protein